MTVRSIPQLLSLVDHTSYDAHDSDPISYVRRVDAAYEGAKAALESSRTPSSDRGTVITLGELRALASDLFEETDRDPGTKRIELRRSGAAEIIGFASYLQSWTAAVNAEFDPQAAVERDLLIARYAQDSSPCHCL
jgi:hypothetical protein